MMYPHWWYIDKTVGRILVDIKKSCIASYRFTICISCIIRYKVALMFCNVNANILMSFLNIVITVTVLCEKHKIKVACIS